MGDCICGVDIMYDEAKIFLNCLSIIVISVFIIFKFIKIDINNEIESAFLIIILIYLINIYY